MIFPGRNRENIRIRLEDTTLLTFLDSVYLLSGDMGGADVVECVQGPQLYSGFVAYTVRAIEVEQTARVARGVRSKA